MEKGPLVVQLRDKKREGRREQKERKRQGETGREREGVALLWPGV